MKWFSVFSASSAWLIESKIDHSHNICWSTEVSSKKFHPNTMITVQEGQLALLLIKQEILAILEKGSYPLEWLVDTFVPAMRHDWAVVFFTLKTFTHQRWGTATPIVISGPQGTFSLRAHGSFSYQLDNPKTFWRHVPLGATTFSSDEMLNILRAVILNHLTMTMSNQQNDLNRLLHARDKLSQEMTQALNQKFKAYGLSLTSFLVQSLSLPEHTYPEDNLQKLKRLNELYQQGIITQDEFDAKKSLWLKEL